jgi:hypothetical protein
MDNKPTDKKRITAEDAMAILRKSGLHVSMEQADEILALLRILAKIEVEQYLKR